MEKACKNCGKQLEDGQNFCPNCGTRVEEPMQEAERLCKTCGAKLFSCPQCGTPINNQASVKKAKRKKIITTVIISVVIVAIVLLTAFGILCAIAKGRVVGTWISEPFYNESYGGYATRIVIISEDGTYTAAVARNSDKEIVSTEKGTWKMEGRSAVLYATGSIGWAYYTYHLDDTLTNVYREYTRFENY